MGIWHWAKTGNRGRAVLTVGVIAIFVLACEDSPKVTPPTPPPRAVEAESVVTQPKDAEPVPEADGGSDGDVDGGTVATVFEAEGWAPLSVDRDLSRQWAGNRALAALKKKLKESELFKDSEPDLGGATIVKHWVVGKKAHALARIEIHPNQKTLNDSPSEPSKPTETGGLQGAEAAQPTPGGTTP